MVNLFQKKTFVILLIIALQGISAQGQNELQYLLGSSGNAQPSALTSQKNDCNSQNALDYRNIDGSCNNYSNNQYGAAKTLLGRETTADYGKDCALVDRGNPREISNTLFSQNQSYPDLRNLSSMVFTWLQFIDHDITLSPVDEEDQANIPIPKGDPIFDPTGTGNKFLEFSRSESVIDDEGNCIQINDLTAWIDASQVYGSENDRAKWLRTLVGGKLKYSPSPKGALLPCNTIDGDCNTDQLDLSAPIMANTFDHNGVRQKVFVAGDIRAAEQPGLTALHTLFLREHNRLCDLLQELGMTDDEAIYQRARKLVGGQLQAITYHEILPALGVNISGYNGYDNTVDPAILNEFSVAAYRLGHTMVTSSIPLLDPSCLPTTIHVPAVGSGLAGIRPATYHGEIAVRDAFFNSAMFEAAGLEPILLGLLSQTQERVDRFVVDDLRNFLFGAPGQGGLDLVSLNLQRGRDHGLGSYNAVRNAFGLSSVHSYSQISTDPATQDALAKAYPNIQNMDAWAGMLAEDHLFGNSIGPTVGQILSLQFERLRDGDRFWYLIDPMLSTAEKTWLHSLELSEILENNTTIEQQNQVAIANCQPYLLPIAEKIVEEEKPIAELSPTTIGMLVAPNPLRDQATIYLDIPTDTKLQLGLYNMLGQKVWSQQHTLSEGQHQLLLEVSGLSAGAYFLHYNDGKVRGYEKLLVINEG